MISRHILSVSVNEPACVRVNMSMHIYKPCKCVCMSQRERGRVGAGLESDTVDTLSLC